MLYLSNLNAFECCVNEKKNKNKTKQKQKQKQKTKQNKTKTKTKKKKKKKKKNPLRNILARFKKQNTETGSFG